MTEEGVGTNTSSNLEDVAREVTFPMEHEAPAHAGETTATAVSLYSASTAIGVRKRQSDEAQYRKLEPKWLVAVYRKTSPTP